jgi:hypothetical protein
LATGNGTIDGCLSWLSMAMAMVPAGC